MFLQDREHVWTDKVKPNRTQARGFAAHVLKFEFSAAETASSYCLLQAPFAGRLLGGGGECAGGCERW